MYQQTYLIIGGDSQIGSAVAHYLKGAGEKVCTTTRRSQQLSDSNLYLDLSDDVSQWKPPQDISVAFFFAAVTSVEKCRTDPEGTKKINVANTILLAKRLIETGTTILFPSTNLVFDGRIPYVKADAKVSPRVEYGRQKAGVEQKLLELGTNVIVVRLTKVIGPSMTILKDWYENLRKKQIIHPFSDMVVSPIPLDFTVKVLISLAQQKRFGIWHLSGKEDVSYEQIARQIARKEGAPQQCVQPIKAREFGLNLEHIPKYTTLDMSEMEKNMKFYPPDVWETIDSFLGLKSK